MRKIVCTVTNDLTYDQRMIRICNTLTEAGFAVELVGRQRPSSLPLENQPFRQRRLRCRFHRGKLFYLEYNLRLLWRLLRHRSDIICAVDLDTIAPAVLASRIRGSVVVYDAHEYFTEVPEVIRRRSVQRIWEAVARWAIPQTRLAYTVGPKLAEVFSRRYGKSFEVIRNVPVRQPAPPPSEPQRPVVILYQGALNECRGLEESIRAMQRIDKAQLWLAGEGDLSQTLRQLTRDLGLEGRVRFLGFVKPAELQSLTPRAYLGLNLLHNRGLSYYYSLANKAFDYIQAHRPSLQMDFPEYRQLQEEYGAFHLLPELCPEAIAKAIRLLIEDPDYYASLQENCRRAAKVFCWERESRRLVGLYEGLWKEVEGR